VKLTHRGLRRSAVLGALAVTLITSAVATASGFSIFEAGSRATAVGGAFVARADDTSAMFYNPAGLAGIVKTEAMVGITLIAPFSSLEGGNPYPGVGYKADQKQMIFFPPNFYVATPLGKGFTLSFGTWFPFGLATAWKDQDQFLGRWMSQRVDIRQYAMSLQVAAQLFPWLKVGGGPELRVGDVKLNRNVPGFNPYTQKFVDVAHMDLTQSGFSYDVGWTAGIQLKPTDGISLGASYHSSVNQTYTGVGTFSQILTTYADFNASVAADPRLPFGEQVNGNTAISFPAVTQVGASFNLSKCVTLDLAGVYTQWNSFNSTIITFNPTASGKQVPQTNITHNFENAWSFRAGMSWLLPSEKVELAAGYVYDQTGQPDSDTGPLLPDANRNGYSIGASFKIGKKSWIDFSNLFLFFNNRTVNGVQNENFYGTYKTFANLTVLNFRTSL